MRKLVLLVILSLIFSFSVYAQNTNVSGTVTDSGGQAWVLGTYEFDFVPSPRFQGQYRQNGIPFNPVSITGNLDATASFSTVPVPDNNTITPSGTQWAVTICPQATTKCFTSAPIVITGASQTITSSLVPPAISMSCGPSQKAYADVEVQCQQGGFYFGLIANQIRLCTASTPPNTCNTWVGAAGTAAAGGIPIQTQVNNANLIAGTPCESFNNLTLGPENVDCDWHSKGPNPYVDITRFGARTCNQLVAPCAAGITASISNGTSVATLSSASTFINGDGIVIYGAGSASGLSTPAAPTVTNVLAQMGTGTDLVVTGAAGSTTKCYKIIARTTLGGYTPASPETCTTTGQATLGAVTVNLSGCTRALTVVTCTTSSPHPVLVGFISGQGAEVYIGSTTPSTVIDNTFRGWRPVATASDSTHFTFIDDAVNTLNGATTSCSGCGSGGTATFFVANHLSWTAVSNTWLYYIYGGASGAETLIGVSRPQNIAGATAYTTWDDFANLMGSYTFPPWIPTTPPTVGANNNLSTTIVSGAGTISVTLAITAGATVSNAGARLDATPSIIAAAAAANQKSPLFIPADPLGSSLYFVINSYCDLTPYKLSVIQSGTLYLHETVSINGTGLLYRGDRVSSYGVAGGGGANTWGAFPKIWVVEPVPGIYVGNPNGFTMSGINFQGLDVNGVLLMLVDGTPNAGNFNSNYEDVNWTTSTGNSSTMGYGLITRNIAGISMDRVSSSGGTNVDGATHNAPIFCNGCGDLKIRNSYSVGEGLIYVGGGSITIDADHYNGGFTPLLSVLVTVPSVITLGSEGFQIIMDTVGHPCVSSFAGNPGVVNNGCTPSGYVFQSPSVTGNVISSTNYSIYAQALNNSLGVTPQTGISPNSTKEFVHHVDGPGGISVDFGNSSIFVEAPPPATPTCSVSAGGSIAVGSYTFKVVPVWWNGQEGTPSLASSVCTTTPGNQTITVNWTVPGGNPQSIDVIAGNQVQSPSFPPSPPSHVFTALGSGSVISSIILGGPSALLPNTQGISTPSLLLNGPVGFSDTQSVPVLTASRTVNWPDNNGFVPVSSYQNNAYDNFNRANGGLGSNWTVSNGTLAISSNTVVGTTGGNAANISAWTATNYAPDQFAEGTIVTGVQAGVAVRVSTSANTSYVYDVNGANREIFRRVNGTGVQLTTVAGSFSVGDLIRLEVFGSTLTAFRNGVVDLTVSDTQITSGQPGVIVTNNGASALDNWSGGNLHPIAQLDTEQDWTQPQHFTQPVTVGVTNPIAGTLAPGLYSPRYTITGGAAPTCAVTGAGTGATCTLSSFSTDNSGAMQINSGTTPGALGTWTLTFSAGFPNAAFCTVGPGSGGTTLNPRATVFDNTNGTLGVHAGNWDNNGVAINASQSITFIISYVCVGH